MQEKKYVPKKEVTTYAVAALGQGLVYSCMSSYVTDYYMNVLTLNAMFVILLMLLARVWDAINDPMMGMIMDRHTTKKGRIKKTATPIILGSRKYADLFFTLRIFLSIIPPSLQMFSI